jgi:hypothetical protein
MPTRMRTRTKVGHSQCSLRRAQGVGEEGDLSAVSCVANSVADVNRSAPETPYWPREMLPK